MINQKRRRVFVATAHVGNIGKLQCATARRDRGVCNLLYIVVCPLQAQKHLGSFGLDRAGRRHRILTLQGYKDIACADAERRQPGIGKLDKNPLRPLTEDIDLLNARDMEQLLSNCFGLANKLTRRHPGSLQRIERKCHIGIFIVDKGTERACR